MACVFAAVYSARNEGKAHCFDLIAERFGSDCNYVAIGTLSCEHFHACLRCPCTLPLSAVLFAVECKSVVPLCFMAVLYTMPAD